MNAVPVGVRIADSGMTDWQAHSVRGFISTAAKPAAILLLIL